ncbi:nitrate- and nitrite sensing domain-containing protein [Streptomyces sp. VRA16 Mangrove soil]|uniref:nitrate- and nitrite sensing domain-containing protein n=1 Tax=Streptomyces sp. VRA16 Mangrove soil TaxID=2817434 RepID=UPI001A9CDE5A|nr:nitrate- and nitrite sensing domain-containing protein [Streptomyces sp. VRA16 Mangrove soil]MBO1331489.1 nitrate- and nitrite sensing domain-containing protein [Streptomyces sp. VRA16 Mangrove soil]
MRFRGKSIRRKIVALLMVPLLSLTAIWAFASVITGRAAVQLFSAGKIVDSIGYPLAEAGRVLQDERRQTLVYLADPRASDAQSALRTKRSASDEAMAEIKEKARDSDLRDEMDGEARATLDTAVEGFEDIESLRRNVDEGTVTRGQALTFYTRLIAPTHDFLLDIVSLDNSKAEREGRAVVALVQARELLSQEDALVGSGLVARRLTQPELRQVSDLMAQRSLLDDTNFPLLPGDDGSRYERYWKSPDTAPLRNAEDAVVNGVPGTPKGVTARSWDKAAGQVLDELDHRNTETASNFQYEIRPIAVDVFVRAGIAGVLGLLALLFSVFLSLRIGRGLVRDLRRLRLQAHEASGVRLPSVMRRLASGEEVDVETEAPRLDYDKDEIGQVGQALNTLQRSAVEAAVKQAELRRGVSEVFVNLARRSQVLLHKQLTLLDTMERRTEDTDELADLFRLDHLTTRMRRHAEGLVILSGAAPSRQWRKPVQLMDIVRASVAEVEDYERIEVRRLPRIAVTGPAVADLTHLVAELLENATVFSPPHTAVQVLGESVANGFTLEIHDRGLGMAADALLDANLRLAETPEFELSDTDRLGLFVVSRLAQRQNVRVSLQPSPYGGTTAVVFIPDALLTDAPDTEGAGFRLDRPDAVRRTPMGGRGPLGRSDGLPGLPASVLDGPVELEAPLATSDMTSFPGALGDEDSERGALFRPRRPVAGSPGEQHQQADETEGDSVFGPDREGDHDTAPGGLVPLPRRRAPKLVSSHGRPVGHARPGENDRTAAASGERQDRDGTRATDGADDTAPPPPPADLPRRRARATETGTAPAALPSRPPLAEAGPSGAAPAPGGLPRRVRQASLAPQLKDGPDLRADRTADRDEPASTPPAERDADEVRSRMASLQSGWRRGRVENAMGEETTTSDKTTTRDDRATSTENATNDQNATSDQNASSDESADGTAQGTTSEGDGR